MKIYATLILILFLYSSSLAQRPDYSAQVKSEMTKLSVLSGNWEGTSTSITPNGEKGTAMVTERIYFKLDSTLLVLEGLGKDEEGNIVHSAFGVITFDHAQNKYVMKSFLSNGSSTDADFEVLEPNISFQWGFETPQGGTMKYTLNIENDAWSETGEYSQDGEQWFQFFEMELNRSER